MELMTKQGFKQTEVGLIPEDWKLVHFSDVFSFYRTSNFSKAQMSEDDEIGCIHYGLIHAIENTQYDLKNGIKYYVSPKQGKYEHVRDGDVIMVDASEDLEGVNKSVEVFGVGNKKYISGLHTYLLRDRNSLLVDNFRGIILNSQRVKNQMLQLAVGMKVFGVSKTQLVNVLLPLPPTRTEQKAIATALSDVDELIANLDKLIVKKKAIKQGAMQQLLTPPDKGGKRLPGFSGAWTYEPINDIALITTGGSDTQDRVDDGAYPFYVRSQKVERINRFSFDGEAILTSGDGVGVGKIFHHVNGKFDFHQRVYCIYSYRDNVDGKYLFCQFSTRFFDRVMSMTAKSSVDSVRREMIADMKVHLPPTKKEQQTIAKILSDMEVEIDALESKKAKYQAIKQGMMQELLTGKTRLV